MPARLQLRTSAAGASYYVSPALQRIGVPHAFSTRIGGPRAAPSPAPFDSFNLGNPNGAPIQDDPARIATHYEMLQNAIGCEGRERCYVHQVHGDVVAIARIGAAFDVNDKADALVTDDPSRVLSIRTADCVPILLASEDGLVVAAIHAGWRGAVSDVFDRTIQTLHARHPSQRVGRIVAAIGPCIGFDAFEVGNEVVEAFCRVIDADELNLYLKRNHVSGKARIDLPGVVKRRLPVDEIDTTDRCTFRDADEFFSHRRDRGITGRMAALIGPVAT